MKNYRRLLALCTMLVAMGGGLTSARAADTPNAEVKDVPRDLVLKGDARCTQCHDESRADGKVLTIGKTKHGTLADKRTPTCTSCHGDSNAHVDYKGGGNHPKPDVVFSKKSHNDAAVRNAACLSCHQKDAARMHWAGSTHQMADVTCASCHQIHSAVDPVREKRGQSEVCFTCHKEQRALTEKPSHHPVPEGKMGCSSCHSVHGTMGKKLLQKDTVNETCFMCHAEKRGPYLWSHQPVTEDCDLCHNPHGTTADTMLKVRAPFLCLECHDPSSHLGNVPGVIGNGVNTRVNAAGKLIGNSQTSSSTPTNNWNTNTAVGKTQGMSCMNCHTDIHGSNNPGNSANSSAMWR
jgi:DmsE family decaheme c-type cytochrome